MRLPFAAHGERHGYLRQRRMTSSAEELLELAIKNSLDVAVIVFDAEDLLSWNRGAEKLFGYRSEEFAGLDPRMIFTPEDRAAGIPEAEMQCAMATGRSEDERWHLRADGSRFWACGILTLLPNRHGFVKIVRDQTQKHATEERLRTLQESQRLLIAELQHRTRNLLALIQAIMRKSARKSTSFAEFMQDFEERLRALSRAQSLVTNASDGCIDMHTLIQTELWAHRDAAVRAERTHVHGTPVRVPSLAAQMLALVLHELTTNAVKYGALSQENGTLDVSWTVEPCDHEQCVVLDWSEHHVEMPDPVLPRRKGYGSELIERALPYQLNARTYIEYGTDGLHCSIRVPLYSAAPVESQS